VVFLSEHSEFSFAKKAIKHGIFDYIVKPVDPNELNNLLEKVKRYIKDRKEAQSKMQTLQDKLTEKIDIYYPRHQIELIIRYILESDIKAVKEVISIMVGETAVALEYDTIKTAIVLQKAYNEIWVMTKKIMNGWKNILI